MTENSEVALTLSRLTEERQQLQLQVTGKDNVPLLCSDTCENVELIPLIVSVFLWNKYFRSYLRTVITCCGHDRSIETTHDVFSCITIDTTKVSGDNHIAVSPPLR